MWKMLTAHNGKKQNVMLISTTLHNQMNTMCYNLNSCHIYSMIKCNLHGESLCHLDNGSSGKEDMKSSCGRASGITNPGSQPDCSHGRKKCIWKLFQGARHTDMFEQKCETIPGNQWAIIGAQWKYSPYWGQLDKQRYSSGLDSATAMTLLWAMVMTFILQG